MPETSESSNTTVETTDATKQKNENTEVCVHPVIDEKALLESLKSEKGIGKMAENVSKPKVCFDDEKWTKICKITRNILLANVKQYNTDENKTAQSNMKPVILSENLKVTEKFTPTTQTTSLKLWNLNTLELISLASTSKDTGFTFSFKVVDSGRPNTKFPETGHKQKSMHKLPPITIQGKQYKYDSSQLISLIQKSQRQQAAEKNNAERKERVLEKFNLKGEVKIPPNWDKRVGYENSNWDMPSNYGAGGIFSLGALTNEKKDPNSRDLESATTALKNLSVLVQDFQVKKTQPEPSASSDDLSQLNINDINNFAFIDDDVDDSLKCSRFTKFFKVLKDQQDNQQSPSQ